MRYLNGIIIAMEKEKVIHYTKFWKPNIKEDMLFFKGHFNTFEFDKHAHEELTITMVNSGKMRAFLDGFSHSLSESAILTINPDSIHACRSEFEDGYSYTSLYFNEKHLKELAKNEFGASDIYFKSSILEDKQIYQKLFYLIKENEANNISKLEFESGLIESLKDIFKSTSNNIEEIPLSSHDTLIKKAKEYISDNYSLNISLDDLSNTLDISKYHFLRIFKENVHLSPHNYLMNRRLEKAKQFLRDGNSIIETAYNCGFNDQSHLSRRFKASTGVTPGNYQKFFL